MIIIVMFYYYFQANWVFLVREHQVIDLSSESLGYECSTGTEVVQASPSCPAVCLFVESVLNFWGEGTASVHLFNCASSFQAGHLTGSAPRWTQQGRVWGFCLTSVHLSICQSLTLWAICNPFSSEKPRVVTLYDWLFCLLLWWNTLSMCKVEGHPFCSIESVLLEMHKSC